MPLTKISLALLSRRDNHLLAATAKLANLFAATLPSRLSRYIVLARNMGTSVKMLEQFYGHTSNRAMASELTKSRAKEKKTLPWE